MGERKIVQITKELLQKLDSKVLLALYKNSAPGEQLEALFEEEILDRMEKSDESSQLTGLQTSLQEDLGDDAKPPAEPDQLQQEGAKADDAKVNMLPQEEPEKLHQSAAVGGKRRMSAAGREAISRAQKRRWAKTRKERSAARKDKNKK